MTYFIRTVASADVIEIIMMIIHLPSFLPSEVNVHRRANLLYSIREQRGGGGRSLLTRVRSITIVIDGLRDCIAELPRTALDAS